MSDRLANVAAGASPIGTQRVNPRNARRLRKRECGRWRQTLPKAGHNFEWLRTHGACGRAPGTRRLPSAPGDGIATNRQLLSIPANHAIPGPLEGRRQETSLPKLAARGARAPGPATREERLTR